MAYPWYQILENSSEIRQGDFILECPIMIPPTNFNFNTTNPDVPYDVTIKALNTVVASQSCDLENEKIDIVLVCAYYALEEFIGYLPLSDQTGNGRKKKLDSLRQGNLPSYHLLNKDPHNGLTDFSVVDFRNVYGVNFQFLKTYVSSIPSRARLLPPYREHLSQAFARFFMRVGLPNDIEGLQ